MAIVIPDEGKLFLLNQLIRQDVTEIFPFVLRLFQNDVTPDADTVRADLTESSFAGYLPVELVRADWTAPLISDDRAESVWGTTPVAFTPSSGSQFCYGYFVTDIDDNFVLWAERKPVPSSLDPTHPLYLIPVMRLRQLA